MWLRYTLFLGLSFFVGLLVGRSYLPGQPGQTGAALPREPAHMECKGKMPSVPLGGHGAPLRTGRTKMLDRSHASTEWGLEASREVLPRIEQLRIEYAGVLRNLGFSEADVQGMVENLTAFDSYAVGYANEGRAGNSATTPQDIALEFEQALVSSGIAPEQARVRSDDFVQQSFYESVHDETGLSSPHVTSPNGKEVPTNDVEMDIVAPTPTPQDIALEFEQALVDSGIAPKDARKAANNFLEQSLGAGPR
jgi:hypothetical protein